MADPPIVSIIVVNWNTADLLSDCLASVRDVVGLPHEVLVADNASTDHSVAVVRERFPEVKLLPQDSNLGYARANNAALEHARGEYLLLLNPDARILPGAVESLVAFLQDHPRAGIAGPPLQHPDGRHQASVGLFPTLRTELLRQTMLHRILPGRLRREAARRDTRRVEWVTGAALCITRGCFEAIGPLDANIFLFYEDTDWCRRASLAGFEVWFVDGPGVRHVKAAASGRHARARTLLASLESTVYYFEKHHPRPVRPALRTIAFLGASLRSIRAALLWTMGRDRADQRERLRAYAAMLAWAVRGGEVRR